MVPLSRRILLIVVSVLVVLCHEVFADRSAIADEVNAEFDAAADFVFDETERSLEAHTVETRCNFWCQLKNSLGLTIVGLLLICVAPCLMWKNEGRHVTELRRIDFCKNQAVVVENSDLPSGDDTGRLVHFTGQVSVGEAGLELAPGTGLNITAPLPNALIIRRTCSIYQKFEDASQQVQNDRIGGGQTTTTTFTCREDWTPMGPQPERLPHLPEHTNSRGIWDALVRAAGGTGAAGEETETAAPPPMRPGMPPQMAAMLQVVDPSKAPHGISVSPAAHVGGFGLTEEIVLEEPSAFQTEWAPLPAELVPDTVEGCEGLIKGKDGILRTNAEVDQPTNGDVMVQYEYVADGFDCSFVVEQIVVASDSDPEVGAAKYSVKKADVIDDKCFGTIHDNLGVIWMVRKGRHGLPEMIDMAKQDEKAVTKLLRIVCYVLLIAGWIMLFSIFTTLLNTLPILGKLGYFAVVVFALVVGTVCCCFVTAVAYIRYRPLIALGIIALALGIWGIVAWSLNEAAENSVQPTFAPTAAPRLAF